VPSAVYAKLVDLFAACPIGTADSNGGIWSPSVVNELMSWTVHMTAIIDSYSPGDSYDNFPDRFLGGWENAYYGSNWDR
jgi:hypothetical protein